MAYSVLSGVVCSEDICKSFAGLLKPGKAQQSKTQCPCGVHGEQAQAGQFSPIHQVSRHFDGGCQRVQEHERLVSGRQRRSRVKNGRQKHQHGDEYTNDLTHIAQVHPQRGQRPAQPHDKQHQWQNHKGQQQYMPVRHAKEQPICHQPDTQADHKLKQGAAHADPGQHFKGEDDFLDVVDVGQYQTRSAANAFSKQVEDHEAGKQDQCEFGFGVAAASAPACFEDDAEHECVDRQHEDGIGQRPENAQHGAFVAAHHFAVNQVSDQAFVAPKAGDHLAGRCGEVLHCCCLFFSERVQPMRN